MGQINEARVLNLVEVHHTDVRLSESTIIEHQARNIYQA